MPLITSLLGLRVVVDVGHFVVTGSNLQQGRDKYVPMVSKKVPTNRWQLHGVSGAELEPPHALPARAAQAVSRSTLVT